MKITRPARTQGQTYIIAMGFMAVAATIFFLVINSQRAVSDKINLVNAADAAAYSGAAMAARELNFMALTNRTMIANEVAIGHVMSYQLELDVIEDAAINGIGGLLGNVVEAFFDFLGGDDALGAINNLNQLWTGAYILGVSSVNALYQDYQVDEYKALAAIGGSSVIENTMLSIISQYANPDNVAIGSAASVPAADLYIDFDSKRVVNTSTGVEILVNNPDSLVYIANLVTEEDEAGGDDAIGYASNEDNNRTLQLLADAAVGSPFCAMVMFAQPSAPGTSIFDRITNDPANPADYQSDNLWNDCQAYYQNGGGASGAAEPTAAGYYTAPEADGGALLQLLRTTTEESDAGGWILDRDADYSFMGVNIERRGSSEVYWDTVNQQLNWRSVGNDTIRTRGLLALLFSFSGSASASAKGYADDASGSIDTAISAMLELAGLCDGEECDTLNASTYNGITRYAILNPKMADAEGIKITTVLHQRGTCNDPMGSTENGVMSFSCANADDALAVPEQSELFAAAQASIFYARPPCGDASCSTGFEAVDDEVPNLFNPFWQARLVTQ